VSADAIIAKLEKVKRTGPGNWVACCPAHEDRSPSMTIKEADDGRVLVHCFAGCSAADIIGAVGLDFEALFPPRPKADLLPAVRRPYPAADVLEALREETLIVLTTAAKIRAGETLSEEEFARLVLASARIERGRTLANG
jgi:hypothetical protein